MEGPGDGGAGGGAGTPPPAATPAATPSLNTPPGGPPPAAPAAPATPGTWEGWMQADGNFRTNWAENLPDSVKPYSSHVSKHSNIESLIADYGRLAASVGSQVHVPADFSKATPAEITAFRQALNVPEKPDAYGLDKAPEDYKGKEGWQKDHMAKVADVLHKGNVPLTVAQELAKLEAARLSSVEASTDTATKARLAQNYNNFVKEFNGDANVAKEAIGKALAVGKNFGIADLDNPDPAAVASLLVKLHKWTSDSPAMRAGLGMPNELAVAMTENPGALADDMLTNKSNPKYQLLKNGDEATVKEWNQLVARARAMR